MFLGTSSFNHNHIGWNHYYKMSTSFRMMGIRTLWEIVHELEESGCLLAVPDGSVKFHEMSFGWILVKPNVQPLAT
jgi:hypothetical protein